MPNNANVLCCALREVLLVRERARKRCIDRGIQRKARDIVIHNIIYSSELARMCGMSYISQLGSVKNTHLAARNPKLAKDSSS